MDYQIVHSTVGRLRIRVPRLSRDTEFAQRLSGLVESLAGVTSVRSNPAACSIVITYETGRVVDLVLQEQLAGCIQKARGQEPDAIAPITEKTDDDSTVEPQINRWQDLAIPGLSLSLALLAAPLELPAVVLTVAVAGAAIPWFMRAADSIVNHRHLNIDLLDSLWMTLQTVQGQYAAPALKTCLVEVRRALRGTVADDRVKQALHLLTWLDQPCTVERDGEIQTIPANTIQVGDRVQLKPGDWIAVDGWVVEGAGYLDESNLTNTAEPVFCSKGEAVYAATQLVSGELWVLAERIGVHTRVGMMAQHLQTAPVHDTEIGIRQAEFVKAAIAPTIALGGTIFLLTGNLGAAISPFQFDFGSGIPISVHSTLLLALTEAAKQGIYIRTARILEQVSQLDVVVLDATGLGAQFDPKTEPLWQELGRTIAILRQHQITAYWVAAEGAATERVIHLGIQPHHVWVDVPGQVSTLVEALRHQGRTVGYVGFTEASLIAADVVIQVLQPGAVPSDRADVVLVDADLQLLDDAITIAKRAMTMVYENTAIIVLPNLLVQIGGGILLGMNPVINVITNNSSALIAEFVHGAKPLFKQSLRSGRKRQWRAVKPLPEARSPVFKEAPAIDLHSPGILPV